MRTCHHSSFFVNTLFLLVFFFGPANRAAAKDENPSKPVPKYQVAKASKRTLSITRDGRPHRRVRFRREIKHLAPNPSYPVAIVVIGAKGSPGIDSVYLVDLRTATRRRFVRKRSCFLSTEGLKKPWSPAGRYLVLMEGDVIEDDHLRISRALRVFDIRRLRRWLVGKWQQGIRLTGVTSPEVTGMTAHRFERWISADTFVFTSSCCSSIAVFRYQIPAKKREHVGSCRMVREGDRCKWVDTAAHRHK